jgi:hypothetical protein
VGASCTTGDCAACGTPCGPDPNSQLNGAALPCACTFTQ